MPNDVARSPINSRGNCIEPKGIDARAAPPRCDTAVAGRHNEGRSLNARARARERALLLFLGTFCQLNDSGANSIVTDEWDANACVLRQCVTNKYDKLSDKYRKSKMARQKVHSRSRPALLDYFPLLKPLFISIIQL